MNVQYYKLTVRCLDVNLPILMQRKRHFCQGYSAIPSFHCKRGGGLRSRILVGRPFSKSWWFLGFTLVAMFSLVFADCLCSVAWWGWCFPDGCDVVSVFIRVWESLFLYGCVKSFFPKWCGLPFPESYVVSLSLIVVWLVFSYNCVICLPQMIVQVG